MDISKIKTGAVVRLTGKIAGYRDDEAYVLMNGGSEDTPISRSEMEQAELVSPPPVTFTPEQLEAVIAQFPGSATAYYEIRKWVSEHTSKE